MRDILLTTATTLMLTIGFAHAESTNDDIFANAALRELHNLAVATAKSQQAAKDSDLIGCREAYDSIQNAAHEALTDIHQMSFEPIDALNSLSGLLRVSQLAQGGGCPSDSLLLLVGQAIIALRTDYSIGNKDWYNASDDIETKNPLRYAQSLSEQNYSWVDVRPKGMNGIAISDWKAEMASNEVDDPSIENSGDNLKAIEVDYRKNSDDSNSYVYFYRSKADVMAEKQQVENNAKAATKLVADAQAELQAEADASKAEWGKKLTSLPYMMANNDAGFKLVYAVCKDAGKFADGMNICNDDGSHDWSGNPSVPYRWFADIDGCDIAMASLNAESPSDVHAGPNDRFVSYCVPASKANGRILKGYKKIVSLNAPDAFGSDDNIYADLRDSGSSSPKVFKTFNACYANIDATLLKVTKDLGVDENGRLLSDKTKYIGLTANCVRIY